MEKILKGIAASPGIAAGKVKIIKNNKSQKKFNKGDVLVAKMTDPTMVIMMAKASAIVTEIGGLTSHPAIVSREMGIPCVVGAKGATKILQDGMELFVNGTKGVIILKDNI